MEFHNEKTDYSFVYVGPVYNFNTGLYAGSDGPGTGGY